MKEDTERRGEGKGRVGGKERNVTNISDVEKKLQDERGDDEQPEKVWLYLLIKPSFAFVLLGIVFRMSELQEKTFPFPAGLSGSSSSTGSKAQLCGSVRTGEQRSA